MISEEAVQWILIFGPLAISPGPANVLFAASGSSFGVKKSIPFWLGTNVTCIFQSLAIGFGFGYILLIYPTALEILRNIGVLFLFYLAYKFFQSTINKVEKVTPLSFKDGVIVEILNVKYLIIPTVMFTQFITPASDNFSQVFVLTAFLAILTMASNLIWVIAGKSLTNLLFKSNIKNIQGAIFGLMLLVTALWIAVS